MWLIRCTQKLRQELGVPSDAIDSHPPASDCEWYADLVRMGSQKLVVFTHATTLFTVVALGVKRSEIRALDTLLRSRLGLVLERLEIAPLILDRWGTDCLYAPTASRQILGSMNELIKSLRFFIQQLGGIAYCNEVDLSLLLSDIIMSAIDYDKPIDRFLGWLSER